MEINVEKIRKEMKRLGWTFARLAEESGFKSRQAVFHYVRRGKSIKSIKGAEKIARALDIPAKDLFR